jgi:integrase
MSSRYGDGSVFQLKSGKWSAQVTLGYRPNGRRIRRTRTCTSKAEAIKKLQRLREDAKTKTSNKSDAIAFGDFANYCLENHLTQTCKQSTVNGYRDLLERYTKSYLWHMRLRDIDPDHIIRLMKQLENHGLNNTSRKRVRIVVGRILQMGVEQRIIAINAVKLTPVPRKDSYNQKTRVKEPLTQQEAKELIRLTQDHDLGVIIQISIATGMRRGETLGLKWSDINFDSGEVKIQRGLKEQRINQADGSWRTHIGEDDVKTRNSRRTLTLGASTIKVLKAEKHKQQMKKLVAGNAWQETDYVFTNDIGGPLNPNGVSKRFSKLLEKLGCRHIRYHDMRHTTAVLLLVAGTPLEEVSQLLGHSSISITKDTYAPFVPALSNRAIERMEDVLGGHEYYGIRETGAIR